MIEGLNGGGAYHVNYGLQDYVWKDFFDEGGRKYPLVEGVME
ncbi:hypothetical protein ACFL3F_00140 [Planctomycetota bacterium]